MCTKVNIEVDHAVRLAAHLLIQRKHGKYCDVCICVEEKRFLAHKSILSSTSPKLDSLIMDAIGQSNQNQDIEIEIQGVSSVGFETLLEYFYTGNLHLKSDTVMPVWMTAAYLELPKVVKLCDEFCQKNITCVSSNSENVPNEIPQKSDSSTKSNTKPVSLSSSTKGKGNPEQKTTGDGDRDAVRSKKDEVPSLTPLQTVVGGDYKPRHSVSSTNSAQPNRPDKWTKPVATEPTVEVNCEDVAPSSDKISMEASVVEVQCDFPLGDERPAGCEDIMMEVERLRMQHEHLKRLQYQKKSSASAGGSLTMEPQRKKIKKVSKPTNSGLNKLPIENENSKTAPNPEILGGAPITVSLGPAAPSTSKCPSPAFTRLFQAGYITPVGFKFISPDDLKDLYHKYSMEVEQPVPATCTASDLLQKGKSRIRKSTEQNALNTTIRFILDRMKISESTDPAVEDALILIMDRFDSLRVCINNPTIRRNLLIKVRHSIHCKKWRLKRQMLKDGDTSSKFKLLDTAESNEDNLHG